MGLLLLLLRFLLLLFLSLPLTISSHLDADFGFKHNASLFIYASLTNLNATSNQLLPGAVLDLADAAVTLVAVDHVNHRNGSVIPELANLTCPVRLTYTLADSLQQFNEVIRQYLAYKEIFSGPPDAIIGAPRSSSTIPLSFVSNVDRVPIVGNSATSLELDSASSHPFFSRTIPSDAGVARAIVIFLQAHGYERGNVIYIDDAYGKTYKDVLFAEGQKENVLLNLYPVPEGDEDAMDAALDEIAASELNVIVGVVFDSDLARLILQAEKKGLSGEGRVWIFSDSIGSLDFVVGGNLAVAKALNGSLQIIPAGGESGTERFDNFVEQLPFFDYIVDEFNEALPGGSRGFDESSFFPKISIKVGEDFFSNQVTETPFYGAYAFDAVLAVAFAIEEHCEAFINSSTVEGAAAPGAGINLIDIFTTANFTFEGVTGTVQFNDVGSRELSTASVIADNLFFREDGSFYRRRAGRLDDSGEFWVMNESLRYPPGNVTIAPPFTDPPKVTRNEVTGELRLIAFMFASFVIMVELLGLAWISYSYNNPILRAQQPAFLLVIAVGCVLFTCSIYFTGWNDDDFSFEVLSRLCNCSWWFVSLGQTLIVTGFILKLYRIVMVYSSLKTLRTKVLTAKDISKALVLVVVVNIACLLLWTLVSPLQYVVTTVSIDRYGQVTEEFGACEFSGTWTVIIPLFLLHGFEYFAAIYLACRTQDIPSDLQDSKWLTLVFFVQAQILLLGVPILFAINDEDSDVRFLVLSSIISLASFSTIVLLIAPKAYRMRHGPKRVQFTTEKTDSFKQPSRLSGSKYETVNGQKGTALEELDTDYLEAKQKSIGAAERFSRELKAKDGGTANGSASGSIGKQIKEI